MASQKLVFILILITRGNILQHSGFFAKKPYRIYNHRYVIHVKTKILMNERSKSDFKILLVNPPSGKNGAKFIREGRCQQELGVWTTVWPPVSLAITGNILKKTGYYIKIIDCPIENVSWNLLEIIIKEFKPDLIISSISTPTLKSDLDIVSISKNINNNIKIAVFGVHVTVMPEDALKLAPELDFVIRGEPEITASCLANAIFKKENLEVITGTSHIKDGKIKNNPDREFINNLDELPFPAWSEIDRKLYKLPITGEKFLLAIPHRGCPFNCIFCASKPYYGRKTRFRSPEKFVDELAWVGDEFKIKNFLFWAETYTINKEFVLNVNKEILKRKLKIKWVCNSRVDTIDEEMITSMKEAGCWMIGFGIESGNQKILDAAGKKITLDQIRKTIKMTKDHGLTTTGHVIIGLPGESKDTALETIKFINNLPMDFAQFYTAAPWPGTDLFNYAREKGILTTDNFQEYTQQKGVMETDTLSADEMTKYCNMAYRNFYFRPKIMLNIATQMIKPSNLLHTLSSFLSFFLKGKTEK